MFFISDTRFYASNTGYINYYNELIKNVPNPARQQILDLITNSFMKRNKNERVIIKSTTYYALSKKERQNVALVVTNTRA